MDTIISKTKGMAEGREARRAGLVGVFETLSKEHGEVAALIERLRKMPERRNTLWPKIRAELLAHERGELRVVYPLIRVRGGDQIAAEHEKEADQLENTIDELDATETSSAAWLPLFEQLATMVVNHAATEEKELFPAAQALLGEQVAKDLQPKFLASRKHVLNEEL
jgi:hemerythrin superfamily protein